METATAAAAPADAILTPEEGAALLRVSLKQFRAWLSAHIVAGQFRAGRLWRIDRRALDKAILGGSALLSKPALQLNRKRWG